MFHRHSAWQACTNETYLFWPELIKIYKTKSDQTKFYYVLNDEEQQILL